MTTPELKPDPTVIYLQPQCDCDDPIEGRLWCQDDVWGSRCEYCEKPIKATKYFKKFTVTDEMALTALHNYNAKLSGPEDEFTPENMPRKMMEAMKYALETALNQGGEDE